ncbi:MAG: DAK2 domain-containing protein [Erysipelotrichaceae bacterium]|nr:DAK2 domain-containing protein [Erysipelotrichaceae bacterium]
MKEINGVVLKQMIISATNHLYNNYPEIDALNVFPVPDGDTGMNMNLTLSSGAKEIANRNDTDAYEIAKAFSKGLLMGARGNSGVITSQIFRGFSQALEGKKVIKPRDFADAWANGKEVAYKAVMRPVEGTMLTVIRESSQALSDKVRNDWTIKKCMSFLLKEARASLERTPDLLPVLKESGVVDSGGAGIVVILEGMESGLKGDVIQKSQATATDKTADKSALLTDVVATGEEFGYCTEFVLGLGPADQKRKFNEERFGNVLNAHGDSIVLVVDEEDQLVKVHIHTLNPGNILNYAQQFGEFKTIKIDNMTEQHHHLEEEKQLEKQELKDYAIISVASGAGVSELFKTYNVDYVVQGGQTMNPSTEDFIAAIEAVNAKHIFILPNNSNIVMSAKQACEVVEDIEEVNAQVIESKTIPQGLMAAMHFNPEVDPETNFEEMSEAMTTIKTGQVTYAIKDTTVEGIEVKKDQFMALNGKKIEYVSDDKFDTAIKLIEMMIDDLTSIVTVLIGEDVSKEDAEEIEEVLTEKYDEIEFDFFEGNQPVYSFIIGVE